MKNKIPIEIHDAVFIPAARCSQCGKTIDAATGLQSRVPKDGDFSVCFYCGQLMIFTADKKLRVATRDEMKEFRQLAPNEFLLAEMLSLTFKARRSGRVN